MIFYKTGYTYAWSDEATQETGTVQGNLLPVIAITGPLPLTTAYSLKTTLFF
jgi:hypothetical protein